MPTIREQHAAAKSAAHTYIDGLKAKGGGNITEAELAEARRLSDVAVGLKKKVDRQESLSVFDGLQVDETLDSHDIASGVIRTGEKASARWAKGSADTIRKHAAQFGAKAALGVELEVPRVLVEPVPLQQRPSNVLQLIPTATLGENPDSEFGGSTFNYAVQTLRQHAATAVKDGDTKPESQYGWDARDGRVRVYAHLSQPVPERYLSDYRKLTDLLTAEMHDGLLRSVETDVLAGPAASEESERFTGILNTAGIRTVTAADGDDLLATLSNGWYALANAGDTATAWLMNPTDVQRLILMRENGTTGPLMFGSGRSSFESIFGNAPIVESTGIPAGTVLVGDFDQTRLVVRETANLLADRSGDRFETNTVRFRVEGRYGFAVLRPSSFAKVTLPA